MQKEILERLQRTLSVEYRRVDKLDIPVEEKLKYYIDIRNMQKVLSNYNELEPMIKTYINNKARREKFRDE